MKILIALAFALTATSAQASNYQCTARGYDKNNFSQTVRGFMRPEMFQARESALSSCRMRRLTHCRITFCHEFARAE